MSAKNYRTFLKWIVTGLAAALALGGLVAYVLEAAESPISGPASLIGWAIPLAGVFVVVAIAWFLLLHERDLPAAPDSGYVQCASCGQIVGRDWRMCPYCGAMPVRAESKDETSEPVAT